MIICKIITSLNQSYLRFGINKVKLQHGAGYIPLSVECDYKSTGICQYPLLHDLDGRAGSGTFELIGDSVTSANLYSNSMRQLNTKSQAFSSSAILKPYRSKVNAWIQNTGYHDRQVR